MKCLKCGAELVPGIIFCRNCGSRVDGANQVQPNINTNINNSQTINNQQSNNINQNSVYSQQFTVQSQVNQPVNSTENIDNELLQISYIGDSYTEFLFGGGKSPLWVFLFGVLYLLYRKMYILSAICLAIYYIIIMLVPNIIVVIIVNFVFNFIMMLSFKKLYMSHVDKEINKIKIKNPNASKEELVEICIKKGGTSIISSMIFVILMVFLSISFLISQMNKLNENQNSVYDYISGIEGKFKIDKNLIGPMTINDPNQIELDPSIKVPEKVLLRIDYSGKVTYGTITYKKVNYEYSNRTLKKIK